MLGRIKKFISNIHLVRGRDCKSACRQLFEMLWWSFRYRISPVEYWLYGFFKRGRTAADLDKYIITAYATQKIRPRLNPPIWEPVLRNKLVFNRYMTGFGQPVAKLYGLFHPRMGQCCQGKPLTDERSLSQLLEREQVRDLIVKPVDGLMGHNIIALRVEDGVCRQASGSIYPLEKLSSFMSRGKGFILEQRLFNHPEIARFNSGSLNTCRVVSFINQRGQYRLVYAMIRFGRKHSITDNMEGGGVACAIDLTTGIIGRGNMRPTQTEGGWYDAHPDSGETFAGSVIPWWPEALELVKRAAYAIHWCNSVGWDVAITPQGPILVEGNGQWGVLAGQALLGGLLTQEFKAELREFGLYK